MVALVRRREIYLSAVFTLVGSRDFRLIQRQPVGVFLNIENFTPEIFTSSGFEPSHT